MSVIQKSGAPPSLGIDPGLNSGAAVLRFPEYIAWWVWLRTRQGLRLTSPAGIEEAASYDTLATAIGQALAVRHMQRVPVVIEGLFIAKRAGIQSLYDATDDLITAVSPYASVIHRPKAVERRRDRPPGWRRTVLGIPDDFDEKRAEMYAIDAMQQAGLLPKGLTRVEQGALSEAWCLSRWPDLARPPRA